MSAGKLPVDTASFLRDVIEWLDAGDRAFAVLARHKGERYNASPEVQDDLRRLVAWFEAHPDADIGAFYAITTGWGKDRLPPDPTEVEQRLRAFK